MPSSTSSFDFVRPVPDQAWRGITLAVVLLCLAGCIGWEIRARAWGYGPTLNDTNDLWAMRRRAVQPGSYVIVGDSRPLFDMDLDALEQGLGHRPIQLAIPGTCAYPVLADLAADEQFHGTVICSIVPLMFFAPGGPLVENSEAALRRYHKGTWAQRAGELIAIPLEEHIAFLKSDEITLGQMMFNLPIPNRRDAQLPPLFPPYFNSLDRERRGRMIEQCAQPGPLQTRVRDGWLPLFTPPPPPSYVPRDAFLANMGKAVEARFHDAAAAVKKIRDRGGRVVFVRFPVTGELKKHEDQLTPRAGPWTRLLKESGAPGIYFEDYPELAGFNCPEWSHLSAPDSVEFTKRLVPHLKKALAP